MTLPPTSAKELETVLRSMGPVLVAMSAGVDSCLLAFEARRVLGGNARAATVRSESTPAWELDDAVAFARRHGLDHSVTDHSELSDPAYVRNDASRCFHCRKNMASALLEHAAGRAAVVMGYTLTDLADWRPGAEAAKAAGVRFPFIEAGMTKDDVRELARRRGLDIHDRPSNACLSSRIPAGDPVTMEKLRQVEAAEGALRGMGFDTVRVRHHGPVARIEVPADDIARLVADASGVERAVKAAGFVFVAVDLAGHRSGSMNALIPDALKVVP